MPAAWYTLAAVNAVALFKCPTTACTGTAASLRATSMARAASAASSSVSSSRRVGLSLSVKPAALACATASCAPRMASVPSAANGPKVGATCASTTGGAGAWAASVAASSPPQAANTPHRGAAIQRVARQPTVIVMRALLSRRRGLDMLQRIPPFLVVTPARPRRLYLGGFVAHHLNQPLVALKPGRHLMPQMHQPASWGDQR